MKENERQSLTKEFENYMQFWMRHMYLPDQNRIWPQISNTDVPEKTADLGSMYLGRIVFGASMAGQVLESEQYLRLAETALSTLDELKNPYGGYYWARKYNMQWLHDPDNVNMAQAFVLYGLASYAKTNPSSELDRRLDDQLFFIHAVLQDTDLVQFLDGFNEYWVRGEQMTRSFATHFHIMEAMVKVYEYRAGAKVKRSIQVLLDLILDRFIEKEHCYCVHRFTEDWKHLPNDNWAGHNAECSWVICHAARAIRDQGRIKRTEEMAVRMMNKVVETARDEQNGGYHNHIPENGNFEPSKSWWPQAEVVLGLLNAAQITGDQSYRVLADEQVGFIRKYFVSDSGEWYAEIDHKGTPVPGTPKVFFWKSMYHTVRYYEVLLAVV